MPSRPKRKGKQTNRLLPTYATIMDLPNEILLMILSQLPHSDLYSLALLCKRLHTMALPKFLSMFGITGSWAVSLANNRYLAGLPGLRIALFTTQIQHLNCNLTCSLGQLRGLTRLVSRMSNVLNVILEGSSYNSIIMTEALVELLGALAGKSCRYLSINGLELPMAGLGRCLEIPHFQSLCSVTIINQSRIFIAFPLQRWIIQSLNSSPLVTLDVTGVPDHLLFTILPQLTLPHLRYFSFSSTTAFRFVFLAAFFFRHPEIRTLTAWQHDTIQDSNSFPAKVLPRLRSLNANIVAMVNLLSSPDAFPELSTVAINPQSCPNMVSLTSKVLAHLSTTNVSSLSLPLYDNIGTRTWLTVPNRRLRSSPERIETSFHHLKSIEVVLVDVNTFDKGITMYIPTWLALFPALTSVRLTAWSPIGGEIITFLKEITLACPKLKSIAFNGIHGTITQWQNGSLFA